MFFKHAVAAISAAGMVVASPHPIPFKFPLDNGFPNPSPKAIATIERHAGGGLPSGALPTKISSGAAAAFQLIGINEIFEVAFFTSLLKNITNDVPGFRVTDKKYHQRVFRRIRAQEELHALGVNGILASTKNKLVGKGCEFEFGTTNYMDAIVLANTFTDIVLSLIPGLQFTFSEDGGQEPNLIPLVGSILAQESEQTGWFRSEQTKAPSAAPFLTGGGSAQFAISILSQFIVPGSCDFIPDFKVSPPMTVLTPPTKAKTQMVQFSVEGTGISSSTHSMAYLNSVNAPYMEPISMIKTKNGMTTFWAKLPFSSNGGFAKGLTYSALVKGTKPLADSTAVAEALAFGPGLMEIQ